jgi:Tol biopolymer transport system component
MRDHLAPFVRLGVTLSVAALVATPRQSQGQRAAPAVHRLFTIEGADAYDAAASPDGRWIAYTQQLALNVTHIFVRPASGGDPIQITTGATSNGAPVFNPAGDRLFFASNLVSRRGDEKFYLMVAPFDSRTGHLSGAARQVTLDGIGNRPVSPVSISPDGRSIVYVECCDERRIRVVPASGGTARTLAPTFVRSGGMPRPTWSADGRAVLFTRPDSITREAVKMRVSIDGGRLEELRRSKLGVGLLAPGGERSAQILAYGPNNLQRQLRIRAADGAIIHRVVLPNGADLGSIRWTNDGRSIVGLVRDQRAVIRLVPTSGGASRALTAGPEYDWPQGWSADGRTLYYTTGDARRPGLYSVNLDGSAGAHVDPPNDGDAISWGTAVGGWALGSTRWLDSTTRRLFAKEFASGRTVTLGVAPRATGNFVRGPGGTYQVDGNAYVYTAVVGDEVEVRRVVPEGSSRVLHRFAFPGTRVSIGVHNARLAYPEAQGDSTRLMLDTGGGTQRRLATVSGKLRDMEVAFARDGRHLAFCTKDGTSVDLFELGADGTPSAPPRHVVLPFEYAYEHSLLPDGRSLVMIAQERGGANAVVALVSFDDPSHPLLLSADDGTSTWGLMLSPDGKSVAYAAELRPRGTTVYRVDVP